MANESNITGTQKLVGGLVTLVGGIIVLILTIYWLFADYNTLLQGFRDYGKTAGIVLQAMEQPIFAQLMAVSSVMLIVASYGFFTRRNWAWILAFAGSILGIFGGWLLAMYPMMVGQAPKHMTTFGINAVVWFTLTLYVKPIETKLVAASFIAGIAGVMNFMNGNAALNKIIGAELKLMSQANVPHVAMAKMMNNPGLIYEAIQKALWLSALAFLIISIAVIYRRNWVLPLGLSASLLALLTGTPVAYIDTFVDKGGEKMSMFFFAPIITTFILIALLVKGEKIWAESSASSKSKGTDIAS